MSDHDGGRAIPDILVVCTANICRSPMAEALLRERLRAFRSPLTVGSAGFLFDDRAADPSTVDAMEEVGIDVSGHRSRILDEQLVRAGLVLTMEARHAQDIVAGFGDELRPVPIKRAVARGPAALSAGPEALTAWRDETFATLDDAVPWTDDEDVSDPYRRRMKHFRRCRDELVELVAALVG